MLKRAWLNVTRKVSKSIILMIILFIVSNLVVASIAINTATKEAIDFARMSLGEDVILTYDMLKMKEKMKEERQNNGTYEPGSGMTWSLVIPQIYLSEVTSVADSEYVIDYRYGFQLAVNAVDFEVIEQESSSMKNFSGAFSSIGDANLTTINAFALLDEVENNIIKLVEGKVFEEANDKEVIISYDLALNNELELEDSIKMSSLDGAEETYTIIGIYDFIEVDEEANFYIQSIQNTIYTNLKSLKPLLSEEEYNDGNYAVNNIKFYLDDPLNVDAFINAATNKLENFEERNLMLDINSDEYEKMIGPINGVGDYSKTILTVIIIAAVVILSLMIVNSIKSRNYEIGVLLSLGERKYKVATQLLIELIIISTFAFGLSFLTSNYVSQKLGNNLLENQIELANEQTEDTYGRGYQKMVSGKITNVDAEAIDEIDVSVKHKDYLKLFGIGYLILFISMIIPAARILKCDPKTILTRTEG